jgi:hypothetical protein
MVDPLLTFYSLHVFHRFYPFLSYKCSVHKILVIFEKINNANLKTAILQTVSQPKQKSNFLKLESGVPIEGASIPYI